MDTMSSWEETEKMNRIITIGREFGSGGKEIGTRLAKRLGINCYDKELLELASKESGFSTKVLESHDEKPINSFFYSLVVDSSNPRNGLGNYFELPINQKIFLAQFETIQRLAKRESCVIVGRCADYALETFPNVFSVFICGDLEDRVNRIAKKYAFSKEKAMELITRTDKKRASYYNYYSDRKWGVASTYDLTLNSSRLGEDGCVEMILHFLDLSRSRKNKKNQQNESES